MARPAHLPFHLIGWGQSYVQEYNCKGASIYPNVNSTSSSGSSSSSSGAKAQGQGRRALKHLAMGGHHGSGHSGHGSIKKRLHSLWTGHGNIAYAEEDIFSPNSDAFGLCNVDFTKHHHGGPITPIYHRKSWLHSTTEELQNISLYDSSLHRSPEGHPINYYHPIRYVYFSECDQVVKFDSLSTLHALSSASNDTTFFVGRRREKSADSDENNYLSDLNSWRNCGQPGYSMHWPQDTVVRQG